MSTTEYKLSTVLRAGFSPEDIDQMHRRALVTDAVREAYRKVWRNSCARFSNVWLDVEGALSPEICARINSATR